MTDEEKAKLLLQEVGDLPASQPDMAKQIRENPASVALQKALGIENDMSNLAEVFEHLECALLMAGLSCIGDNTLKEEVVGNVRGDLEKTLLSVLQDLPTYRTIMGMARILGEVPTQLVLSTLMASKAQVKAFSHLSALAQLVALYHRHRIALRRIDDLEAELAALRADVAMGDEPPPVEFG